MCIYSEFCARFYYYVTVIDLSLTVEKKARMYVASHVWNLNQQPDWTTINVEIGTSRLMLTSPDSFRMVIRQTNTMLSWKSPIHLTCIVVYRIVVQISEIQPFQKVLAGYIDI